MDIDQEKLAKACKTTTERWYLSLSSLVPADLIKACLQAEKDGNLEQLEIHLAQIPDRQDVIDAFSPYTTDSAARYRNLNMSLGLVVEELHEFEELFARNKTDFPRNQAALPPRSVISMVERAGLLPLFNTRYMYDFVPERSTLISNKPVSVEKSERNGGAGFHVTDNSELTSLLETLLEKKADNHEQERKRAFAHTNKGCLGTIIYAPFNLLVAPMKPAVRLAKSFQLNHKKNPETSGSDDTPKQESI